jgi:predicted nucleotide-binding protein
LVPKIEFDPDTLIPSVSRDGLNRAVFIIHGHNTSIKERVARFLERLGVQSVILHEQPNRGQTLIEKFEFNSEVSFAVALLTGDDEGRALNEPAEFRRRARQNVLLELGFFIGKLGRERVCALLEEEVEIPSDYRGIAYIPIDDAGNWQFLLVRELKAAGFDVDANRAI